MSFVFPTNASQVQAFAGALYGVQVGTTTMAQVNADIAANGGLASTLNSYYSATFGGATTASVATTVATNLGLTGDALTSGAAYVEAQLNAAAAGARGQVISSIVNLFAGLSADATFGAAATAWNTKVAAAVAYSGAANVAVGTEVVYNETFTLTTMPDSIPGLIGSSGSTSNSGNDTIKGVVDYSSNATTFDASDVIDGGDGTNSLLLTLVGTAGIAATDSAVAGVVANVQTITITNAGTNTNVNAGADSQALDLTSVLGVTTINANSGNGKALTLDNVTSNVTLGMSGAGGLTVDYVTSVTAGTNDSQSVTLNGTTRGSLKTNILTVDGIENVNLSAVKDSDVTLAGNNLKSITLTGDAKATVRTEASVGKFDAATTTGKVTFVNSAQTWGASGLAVTTGAGDDNIVLLGKAIDKTAVIDGGEGNNILQIANTAGVSSTDLSGVKNIQTIKFAGNAATTVDMSEAVGISNVVAALQTDANNKAGTFEVANLVTGSAVTLESSNLAAANPADPALFDLDGQQAVTLAVKGAATGTADALSINVSNNNVSVVKNTSTLASKATANTYTIDSITASGIETVTINSTGVFGSNRITDLNVDGATSLVITGDQALTIGTTTSNDSQGSALQVSSTDSVSFDASALTGKLSVAVTAAQAANFSKLTGASGSADSLTVMVGSEDSTPTSSGFETAAVVFDADGSGSFSFDGMSGVSKKSVKYQGDLVGNIDNTTVTGLVSGDTLTVTGTLAGMNGFDDATIEGAGTSSTLKLAVNQDSTDFVAGTLTVNKVGNLTIDTTRVDGTDDDLTAVQAAFSLTSGLTAPNLQTLTVVGPKDASNVISLGQLNTTNGGNTTSKLGTIDLSGFLGNVSAFGLSIDDFGTKSVSIKLSNSTSVGVYDASNSSYQAGLNLGNESSDTVVFGTKVKDVVIAEFQGANRTGVEFGDAIDLLDLSAAGIKGVSSLIITDVANTGVNIDFKSTTGQDGHIFLVGIVKADLSAANFVFAA